MTNGCLCCAVKSNAVMALEKLMEKSGKFDYVLIETTGKIPGVRVSSKIDLIDTKFIKT